MVEWARPGTPPETTPKPTATNFYINQARGPARKNPWGFHRTRVISTFLYILEGLTCQ